MKGQVLAQQAKVLPVLYPISGTTTTDLISMKNYAHATFVVVQGIGASSTTITVRASDDAASSNTSAIPFCYWQETTSGIDILGPKATAAVGGITMSSGSNQYTVIEVDAAELPSGKPFVAVAMSSSDNLIGVVAILTGARYGRDEAPTVQS